MGIKKIRLISKCKECGEVGQVGNKTEECIECLDWKMSELRKWTKMGINNYTKHPDDCACYRCWHERMDKIKDEDKN